MYVPSIVYPASGPQRGSTTTNLQNKVILRTFHRAFYVLLKNVFSFTLETFPLYFPILRKLFSLSRIEIFPRYVVSIKEEKKRSITFALKHLAEPVFVSLASLLAGKKAEWLAGRKTRLKKRRRNER